MKKITAQFQNQLPTKIIKKNDKRISEKINKNRKKQDIDLFALLFCEYSFE